MSDLLARARAWAAEDPDPVHQGRARGAHRGRRRADELADRFAGTLEFGTAGLRGALGAGSNRMNRVVVTRAAAGLAAYLKDNGAPRGASVVIGYDARHNSDVFARDTAEVMTGAGLRALVMPRPLPTPLLAFAIRELGCVAGVMVTASHNPPQDNGYKVYLGDGSQIVPPADAEIAARIAAVGAWPTYLAATPARSSTRTSSTATSTPSPAWPATGRATCARSTRRCTASAARRCCRCSRPQASTRPSVVEQQEEPDPDFPTVAFPNPEEPGAMDLAMALAAEHDVDLVVANDPDADRCAAAVPSQHGWRMLRGDEVGALLGHHLLSPGQAGHLRVLDRVVVAARQDGGGARPAVRRDAHRLQVDQPRARASRSATRRRSATASTPST